MQNILLLTIFRKSLGLEAHMIILAMLLRKLTLWENCIVKLNTTICTYQNGALLLTPLHTNCLLSKPKVEERIYILCIPCKCCVSSEATAGAKTTTGILPEKFPSKRDRRRKNIYSRTQKSACSSLFRRWTYLYFSQRLL